MLDKFSGNFKYTAHVFDRTEACDLSDDYTLPDYMPAVGRVLSCTATAAQPTLYLSAGGVECSGGVRYSLLYESADDGSLFCAELPGEYDVMLTPERDVRASSLGSDVSGICDAVLENTTARVTAPRRLTVKSRLRLRPSLRANNEFAPLVHGADITSDSVRKLVGNSSCTVCACATAIPVICRDDITRSELGLSSEDEIRIISTHGEAMINQLQTSDAGIECKGEVNVSLLLSREDDRPRRIIRKLPFMTTLPVDAPLPANAKQIGLRGYGVCPSVTHSANADGISLEASVLISAEAAASVPVSFLKDIYSREADCESAYGVLELHSPVSAFNGHATVSAVHDIASTELDSGMKLCDVSARILPDFEKELSANGKLTITGKLRVSVVTDNGAELIPFEYDSDFRYNAELSEVIGLNATAISAILTVGDIKGRLDADNIVCDCEVCAAVLIETKQSVRLLSEANLTDAVPMDNDASILVCYPSRGETLWDVAKKYRTDIETISEKNSISPSVAPDAHDSIAKVKFLII